MKSMSSKLLQLLEAFLKKYGILKCLTNAQYGEKNTECISSYTRISTDKWSPKYRKRSSGIGFAIFEGFSLNNSRARIRNTPQPEGD